MPHTEFLVAFIRTQCVRLIEILARLEFREEKNCVLWLHVPVKRQIVPVSIDSTASSLDLAPPVGCLGREEQ